MFGALGCANFRPAQLLNHIFILSYTRKSDLVVSEVQMILVSHTEWNLLCHQHLPPPLTLHPCSHFCLPLSTCTTCSVSLSRLWLLFAIVLSSPLCFLPYHYEHLLPPVFICPQPSQHPIHPLSVLSFRLRQSDSFIVPFSAGHVDAGKSTLMGHLLYLLGNVNKRTMHKYEQESKKAGKASFAYAWVLDETGEERDR